MRGVVRCDHCGAPHRREAASTRFRCDWCGGDNRVEAIQLVEELIFAADDRTRDPATRVREALGSRGLQGARVTPRDCRWFGVWQVVNADGEEFVAPVAATLGEEPVIRILPAGPMKALGEDEPSWATDLPTRPAPGEDTEEVIAAARATFDAAETDVVLVRLLWLGIAEFDLEYSGRRFAATQILGTDRVLFETLPARRTMPEAVHERLVAFSVFVAGAIGLGLLVPGPMERLAFEAGWLLLGALYWMVRRDAGALR